MAHAVLVGLQRLLVAAQGDQTLGGEFLDAYFLFGARTMII